MSQVSEERGRGAGPAPKPSVARSRGPVFSHQMSCSLAAWVGTKRFPDYGNAIQVSHMF